MLYIVATPIGNLEDITLRALRMLGEVDFILAEDTRKTGILLKRFKIKKKLVSFLEHNERKKTDWVISELKKGKKIALVSSAGTPSISDPGYILIEECIKQSIKVSSVPGPSAATNALVVSGLPRDKFLFLGFLPRKKGKKTKALKEAGQIKCTIVIFESPFRVKKTIAKAKEVFTDKRVVLVREMTKMHEETVKGSFSEIEEKVKDKNVKGECVLVIDNN